MKKVNEFKTGIFVIVGFILLLTTNWIIRGLSFSEEGYGITVIFSKLAGIGKGTDVRIADGLRVGKAIDITLKDNLSHVKIWLENRIKVSTETKFSIASSSILGEKFISIAPSSMTGSPLKAGDSIRGIDPLSMNGSIEEFGKLMKNFNNLITGDKAGNLVNKISSALDKTMQSLAGIVTDNRKDIRMAVKNMQLITADLRNLSAGLRGIDKKVFSLLSSVDRPLKTSSRKLVQTMNNVKSISDKLLSITKNLNKKKTLINYVTSDKQFYYDFKFIIDNIKRLSYELRKDPSILIWKKKK